MMIQKFSMLLLASGAAAYSASAGPVVDPPPTDCSGATADPTFFSACAADGGCFRLMTPERSHDAGNKFSVGNYYANDLKYCIDHISGVVYAKTSASDGGGYFELDQHGGTTTNQCRVSIDSTGTKLMVASGLTCAVTSSAVVKGIINATLTATTVQEAAPVALIAGEAKPIKPVEKTQNTCLDGGAACAGLDCCFTFGNTDCCCPSGSHCAVHSGTSCGTVCAPGFEELVTSAPTVKGEAKPM